MDRIKVKEALHTAILLSRAARMKHKVELDWLGEVTIDTNYIAFMNGKGELKDLTRDNIEQRLEELISETENERRSRRVPEIVF